MASGYTAKDGRDLDAIFSTYVSGTKPALTGYIHANGQDFANVYQPGNSGVVTGYEISSGVDIGSIFGNGGPIANPGYGNMQAIASQSHGSGNGTANVTMIIWGNGTWTDSAASGQPGSGNWYSPTTSNIGTSYYVEIIFTKTGGNGFGSFVASNIGPVLIGTGDQQASASLTYGAGGVSSATATGTCQVIISTDAAQSHIVSNHTCTFLLEVDVV